MRLIEEILSKENLQKAIKRSRKIKEPQESTR